MEHAAQTVYTDDSRSLSYRSYTVALPTGLKASAYTTKADTQRVPGGLIQPTQVGFVTTAEGFSPADWERPRNSCQLHHALVVRGS